jgi:hypothetical protein
VVCLFSALFAFIKAGLSTVNYDAPSGVSEAHATKGAGKIFAALIAAALLAAVAYAPVRELYDSYIAADAVRPELSMLINNIFAVLSGLVYFVIVLMGVRSDGKRFGDSALIKLCALIMTIAPCFHLIVVYRVFSAEPDLSVFAWEILALSATAIRWVYTLACCAGKKFASVKKIVFFTALSTVLCAIATVGIEEDYGKAVYLFGWVSGILTLILLLKNVNELDIYRDEPELEFSTELLEPLELPLPPKPLELSALPEPLDVPALPESTDSDVIEILEDGAEERNDDDEGSGD